MRIKCVNARRTAMGCAPRIVEHEYSGVKWTHRVSLDNIPRKGIKYFKKMCAPLPGVLTIS